MTAVSTPDEVLAALETSLARSWALVVAGARPDGPVAVHLGKIPTAVLETNFPHIRREVVTLTSWASTRPEVQIVWKTKMVSGTRQPIPTKVVWPGIEAAASALGGTWPARIARGKQRAAVLAAWPHLRTVLATMHVTGDAAVGPADQSVGDGKPEACETGAVETGALEGGALALKWIVGMVKATDTEPDHEFDRLLDVAAWFLTHDASRYSARQVPVPGVHGKWIGNHRGLIKRAINRTGDLGLLPDHPARIHFTYTDPGHLQGGRRYDSATVGDRFIPAYPALVVLIVENKDCAIHFLDHHHTIVVEGEGFGGSTAAEFEWITHAPALLYWGDIDAHGFQILDEWRRHHPRIQSILMDPDTYRTWQSHGTNTDKYNNPIEAPVPAKKAPLTNLTATERATYDLITDPDHIGYRRIEQEHLDLGLARDAVAHALAAVDPHTVSQFMSHEVGRQPLSPPWRHRDRDSERG